MFQHINSYLLQFKRVALPGIGTLELKALPAQLDVADQLLHAPYYETSFSTEDEVSVHQAEYFAVLLNKDFAAVQDEFKRLAHSLQKKIEQGPFAWRGIGQFQYRDHSLVFEPLQTNETYFAPVRAHKVVRENVQHEVLVGDHMMLSGGDAEPLFEEPRRPYTIKIAWVLTILAILFIVYYLYRDQFSPSASGIQSEITPKTESPSYK